MISISRLRPRRVAAAALVLFFLAAGAAQAQQYDGTGTVPTGLLLRRLDGVKRVLMIGAHPDDEDTSLLTTIARGDGVETAYLALTRGDGGQNLIGPELWEGLGVVRTGELLAARKLDGGRQYFSRAFDYGFSKSADEALSDWPEEELLRDVVWVIRSFRPQVIVSVFTGTPVDGHGQHQAAGIVAREAFQAAGDPTRFPDQLEEGVEAWQPLKLYQTSRRRFFSNARDEDDGSLDVSTGRWDPLLGRSYYQLAMESRSQHRSQEMGQAQPPGPRLTGVLLVESRVPDQGQQIFSGVDTTIVGLAASLPADVAPEARRHLEAYRVALGRAVQGFGLDPEAIGPDLMEASVHLAAAARLGDRARGLEYSTALARKAELLDRALAAATGVSFDFRSSDDLVVPGQRVRLEARLWNGGRFELRSPTVEPRVPAGWSVTEVGSEGLTSAGSLAPGQLATWTYDVTLPSDAKLSKLYYLRQPRDGDMYRWPDDPRVRALPRDPEPVAASASFVFSSPAGAGGSATTPGHIAADWHYVGVNSVTGQFEKPVLVVPAISVSVSPAGLVWPQSRSESTTVSVVVRSETEEGSRGVVSLHAPAGWSAEPGTRSYDLPRPGAARTMTFEVRPEGTASAGDHTFHVSATRASGGRTSEYSEGFSLIDYPHIERAALFSPSEATVSVVPLRVRPDLRVGYIMGSGDDGPEAIRQMGADVELLDEATVRSGDFDGFSTVVLGVRAYETREDLRAAAAQLLDFVRRGGTVVMQYNRGSLEGLAPFSLDIGRNSPRVADETAPVRILEPTAPVFTTPNRITDADFDGWVQERGLYFASEWDDHYVPLLELHDPGDDDRLGSTLVAAVGDGVFVFTGLSFFRQWASRVPGAYRLFANLISLDAADWRAFAESR